VSSPKIDRTRMISLLLEADPSLKEPWDEFIEEWCDEPEIPHYIVLGDFARHLVQQLEVGRTERFRAVFNVIETLQLNGDEYVQEAAVIGLLEDLQNGHLHTTTTRDDFVPWLEPESLKAWKALIKFWYGS